MRILALTLITIFLISCNTGKNHKTELKENSIDMEKEFEPITRSKEEWKSILSDEEYYVMIEKGTERPFTGKYWDEFSDGTYSCAACGFELFESGTKFEAHCGWPSFYDALDTSRIKTEYDYNIGYRRTEIMCARCGAHLGHVFEDGPKPTGLRYCVNSVSINLDTARGK
jgi:peptide-methionine (R)-S-oxide reductase